MSAGAITLKGNLPIPENMYQIIVSISQEEGKDNKGCLAGFTRLIDPVIVGTLFGLYKSRELPPTDKGEIVLEKSYEFNVDISSFAEAFNHLLFCLWVRKEGLPDKSEDTAVYREKLYGFLSRLQEEDYYREVLIPFYLSKADEKEGRESSFLYRLWSSDGIGLELQPYSPEYLTLEFKSAKDDFMKNVMAPLQKESATAKRRK